LDTLHNAALSCHVPEADRRVDSRDGKCSIGCRLSITWKVIRARTSDRQRRSGNRRFRHLRRNIRDISKKALSAHFRELERNGIVLRREFREGALLATVPSPTTAAR
jgi:DNA-binding transcriptional ArsR family regulator